MIRLGTGRVRAGTRQLKPRATASRTAPLPNKSGEDHPFRSSARSRGLQRCKIGVKRDETRGLEDPADILARKARCPSAAHLWGQHAFFLPATPPAILETVGDGNFEPAHPEPMTGPGRDYLRLYRLARQDYLSVFRENDYHTRNSQLRGFGRQLVTVNVPDDIKYVMVTRHDNFERKSPAMRRALEHQLGDGLFISDGETWKCRRPMVADIVHKGRIPQFSRHMEEVSRALVTRWAGLAPDTTVDALAEMGGLTAEIIARAVLRRRYRSDAANEVVCGFTSFQSVVETSTSPMSPASTTGSRS